MTRKQLRKRIDTLQEELRQITKRLEAIRRETERLGPRHQEILNELFSACNTLGLSWAEECPSYKVKNKSSFCIIYQWEDNLQSARFCINCPVPKSEAQVRCLMRKLEGQDLKEE